MDGSVNSKLHFLFHLGFLGFCWKSPAGLGVAMGKMNRGRAYRAVPTPPALFPEGDAFLSFPYPVLSSASGFVDERAWQVSKERV